MSVATQKSSGGLKLLLTLLCLALFCGGCAIGVMTYHAVQEAQQSLAWPTTSGKIIRSGVDVAVHRERSTDRERRDRETRLYSATIEYEFEAQGQNFKGSRIAVVSDQFGSKMWAEATTKKFPLGGDVTVSYNPLKPEQCVLEPGRWGGAGFMMILTGILGLFPPLVLRAIWSNKPVKEGFHPETRTQRILQGFEFRERVLHWQPGQLVHLQRDSISLLTILGGALTAGLILGLLFGFVPALVFFSGRGPIFIGQLYLGVSLVCSVICAIWLWFDNLPRETRIDWSSQSIHIEVGSTLRDFSFSDVQELNLTPPKPQKAKSASPGHPPQKFAARINIVANGKTFIVLETECTADAFRAVRSKLFSIARQLADPMQIQVANID